MTENLVVDASVVVAVLLGGQRDAEWAQAQLQSATWLAPHLLGAEVASALRRLGRTGEFNRAMATRAHTALSEMPIAYFPYEPLSQRVWELRDNLTTYDAWYVALAEATKSPLITLDRRMAATPGIKCEVRVPV